jgi:hypothetical protein
LVSELKFVDVSVPERSTDSGAPGVVLESVRFGSTQKDVGTLGESVQISVAEAAGLELAAIPPAARATSRALRITS